MTQHVQLFGGRRGVHKLPPFPKSFSPLVLSRVWLVESCPNQSLRSSLQSQSKATHITQYNHSTATVQSASRMTACLPPASRTGRLCRTQKEGKTVCKIASGGSIKEKLLAGWHVASQTRLCQAAGVTLLEHVSAPHGICSTADMQAGSKTCGVQARTTKLSCNTTLKGNSVACAPIQAPLTTEPDIITTHHTLCCLDCRHTTQLGPLSHVGCEPEAHASTPCLSDVGARGREGALN